MYFIGFLVGVFVTFILVAISYKPRDGTLYFNTDDPDKDVFTIELNIPLGEVPDKRRLILDVRNSHEKKAL